MSTDSRSPTVDHIVELMDPVPAGGDVFIGACGDLNLPRVFGGQVLAQALMAAGHTVDGARPAHSLHAYFVRAGDPRVPVEYAVRRVRDGRRLAYRIVTAEQDGTLLSTVGISFADTDGPFEHQRPAPVAVRPEQLPTLQEAGGAWGGLGPAWWGFDAVEIRVAPRQVDPATPADLTQWTDHVWQQVPGRVGDDPLLHQALLVYASDITQLAAALVPHGFPIGRDDIDGTVWDGVSLDHAVWLHRPARADEWLLFEQCSPVCHGGRALTRTEVFTASGNLVASVMQEALILGPQGP